MTQCIYLVSEYLKGLGGCMEFLPYPSDVLGQNLSGENGYSLHF